MRSAFSVALIFAYLGFLPAEVLPGSDQPPDASPHAQIEARYSARILPGLAARAPGLPSPRPATQLEILQSSALIFSGKVMDVKHFGAGPQRAQPVTQITFSVAEAIRGVRSGKVIQVNEWGGLWNSGERYRPGESVLLFLYPPSKLGLTSPVGGSAGHFRVNRSGRVVIGIQHNLMNFGVPPDSEMKVRDFAEAIRLAAKE